MKEEKIGGEIRVVELFAGVGGFRLGLEGWKGMSSSSRYMERLELSIPYRIVWSNQFEPNKRVQHASNVYNYNWAGQGVHTNADLRDIVKKGATNIPAHELLVGGFPCQDYSVANTLKRAQGIDGEKGALWWEIHKLLKGFVKAGRPTPYLMFENVDRLLNSPREDRGRDFAIILASLRDLDYAVEWRVINAADYGMPQRRRRIFMIAYHKEAVLYKKMKLNPQEVPLSNGVIAQAFGASNVDGKEFNFALKDSVKRLSECGLPDRFGSTSPFQNSGFMCEGKLWTLKALAPEIGSHARSVLRDVLVPEEEALAFRVNSKIVHDKEGGWAHHKGPKSRKRKDPATGHEYVWEEGGMSLLDDLGKPARTIITTEGGASPSRSKHLIKVGRVYRRLTPKELERVSMFPDDYTYRGQHPEKGQYVIGDVQRAFFMGNALVVGVVERLGVSLAKLIQANG